MSREDIYKMMIIATMAISFVIVTHMASRNEIISLDEPYAIQSQKYKSKRIMQDITMIDALLLIETDADTFFDLTKRKQRLETQLAEIEQ